MTNSKWGGKRNLKDYFAKKVINCEKNYNKRQLRWNILLWGFYLLEIGSFWDFEALFVCGSLHCAYAEWIRFKI